MSQPAGLFLFLRSCFSEPVGWPLSWKAPTAILCISSFIPFMVLSSLSFKLLIHVERDTFCSFHYFPSVCLAEHPLHCILTLTRRLPGVTPSGDNETWQMPLASQRQPTLTDESSLLELFYLCSLWATFPWPQRVSMFCASKAFFPCLSISMN